MLAISGFGLFQYALGPAAIGKLVRTYIFKRRIGWVSVIAIMLCTAMVLVVISVMGGWLQTFKQKFRGMSGDIVVYRPGLAGFAGYEEMLAAIRADKDVDEALPLIRAIGLLNILNQRVEGVQVTGLDIEKFSKFNAFRESLWRQYKKPIEQGETPPPVASFDLLPNVPYEAYRPGDRLALRRPGMIVGGPIVGFRKNDKGAVTEPAGVFSLWARLEVVPIEPGYRSITDMTPVPNLYWIVDASLTQLYQLDENSVYVPFDVLQSDMKMTARTVVEEGKEVTLPARCSEIQIKLKPGVDRAAVINRLRPTLLAIDSQFNTDTIMTSLRVETWEKLREDFLNAVENEKGLVTFLFALISIVAIFLIFCILYMIVVEKTRDIGILKSIGTSATGIASIFIGYGLAIGVVGASGGLIIGFIILRYINEIHKGIASLTGRPIWDPKVYAFDRIPSEMDPNTAVVVFLVAVMSAVVGALVPAIRAARMHPIEALRFE
jgi:lipoprotein-releasing system permease protein